MHILITGAFGFIGQELARALLSDPAVRLTLTDVTQPTEHFDSGRVTILTSDLTSADAVASLLETRFDVCYLLHGIMSGGAEANLELGLRVNFDSHRLILDHLRRTQPGIKVIFPSSLAVYGPAEGLVVSEATCPMPQSSYGSQKLMIETLLNDYSRRGLVDGRIVRLPTVIVRPGRPSAAASSFASGIVRESLKGEKNILPVEPELRMWICSPTTVVKNLVLVKDVPGEKFGLSRTTNLPGLTVTVQEILDALEEIGGKEKVALVEKKLDSKIDAIVRSWPAEFNTNRAFQLV